MLSFSSFIKLLELHFLVPIVIFVLLLFFCFIFLSLSIVIPQLFTHAFIYAPYWIAKTLICILLLQLELHLLVAIVIFVLSLFTCIMRFPFLLLYHNYLFIHAAIYVSHWIVELAFAFYCFRAFIHVFFIVSVINLFFYVNCLVWGWKLAERNLNTCWLNPFHSVVPLPLDYTVPTSCPFSLINLLCIFFCEVKEMYRRLNKTPLLAKLTYFFDYSPFLLQG